MYETRDFNLLQNTLARYEYLIERPYLYELGCLPSAAFCFCEDPIQIFKINTLPESSTYQNLSYALNALAYLGQTIGCLLICHQGNLSLYIILKGCMLSSLFYNSFLQVFPNSSLKSINQTHLFLNDIFSPEKYASLSSSLVIPNESYATPLLKQFTELMGTSFDYVAFFLAQPLPRKKILSCLDELYELHRILCQFSQTNYTDYKSDTKSISNSTAKGSGNTSSKSITNTLGNSSSDSHNCYTNLSASTPLTLIAHRPNTVTSTTSSTPGTSTTLPQTTTSNTTTTTTTTSASTAPKNINATILVNRAKGSSSTSNSSSAHGEICGDSSSLTSTHGNSSSQTFYHASAFSCSNRRVQDALNTIADAISRYRILYRDNAFCFSSYFFAPNSETSLRASHFYTGLSQSSSTLSPNAVNCWSYESLQYPYIFEALKTLSHPNFSLVSNGLTVSSTIPILSSELVNTIYNPINSSNSNS